VNIVNITDDDIQQAATAQLHDWAGGRGEATAQLPAFGHLPAPVQPDAAAAAYAAERQYWAAYREEQISRAEAWLNQYPGTVDAVRRAAVILCAPPWAGPAQRTMGIRGARPELLGVAVRCRSCARGYACTPEDDYYNATGPLDGQCYGCAVKAPEPAPAEIAGTIVAKPDQTVPKTAPARRARKRPAAPAASPGTTSEGDKTDASN
jgi:hypothetical protein